MQGISEKKGKQRDSERERRKGEVSRRRMEELGRRIGKVDLFIASRRRILLCEYTGVVRDRGVEVD